MTEIDNETKWRAEFEADGERLVLYCGLAVFPEPKRGFALRWLREKSLERQLQEESLRWYARSTFWAAIAAIFVGIVGVLVTLFSK